MTASSRRLGGEAIGTFFLFATVIGSGIMAERLSGGNVALALLANSLATGGALFALITLFAPVSGAQFNPAVTLALALRRRLPAGDAMTNVAAQLAGGLIAVLATHAMFDLPLVQAATHLRSGPGQWLAEFIATFGLVLAVFGVAGKEVPAAAGVIASYIVAAYWFTASTSFANPAITVARSLTDTFSGIAPADAPGFILAQSVGAAVGAFTARWLFVEDA
ncbi:aquaporin [Sphingomonas sp. GCM10030256]|uniref:aquaporin n=1 Tax=Sphingomonas sp. GCM10030256 TaxID=3273427 RepID=UPI0036089549